MMAQNQHPGFLLTSSRNGRLVYSQLGAEAEDISKDVFPMGAQNVENNIKESDNLRARQ